MSELKPCPFCGGEARHFGGGGQHSIRCEICGITNEYIKIGDTQYVAYENTAIAIATWNHRAQPENEPLTLDELRGMDGEPVWLKDGIGEGWFLAGAVVGSKIYFCEKSITIGEPISGCGKTWLAYSRKPKEEHHETD